MIETKNLTKTFDNFTAVDSLDLKIETGEFFGLLGPNGAGKTTTISLLSTLLLPTKGEILIDGQKLTRNRPDLKRKISVITQEYSMRQDMNMDEIMEYQGRLYFMPRKEIKHRTEELLEFCDLIKFRKRTVRKLSGKSCCIKTCFSSYKLSCLLCGISCTGSHKSLVEYNLTHRRMFLKEICELFGEYAYYSPLSLAVSQFRLCLTLKLRI